jgi:hypothetical protein
MWIALLLACGAPLADTSDAPTIPVDSGVGAPLDPGSCRASADCSGQECLAPGEQSCPSLVAECVYDSDCGTDAYCGAPDPEYDDCKQTVCRAHCDSDINCRAGSEVCDVGTRRCVLQACEDGYACPMYTTCVTSPGGHGCQRDACAADADCGVGVCVDGGCYDQPGTCVAPQ